MALAPSGPTGVSPLFQERDRALTAVRTILVQFGDRLGLFHSPAADDVFGGDLKIPQGAEFRAQATVEELLGTVREEWDPESYAEQEEADPTGELGLVLRRSLLDFGEVFRLYDYERSRGDNSRAHAETLALEDLISLIEEVWHEQSGCYSHLPTEAEEFHVQQQIEENRKLVSIFARQISHSDLASLRWAAIRETPWYREARYLADHSLDEWASGASHWPEVRHAMLRVRQVVRRASADHEERQRFIHASSDAIQALLLRGVVSDPISQALYEAFEPTLPVGEILVQQHTKRQPPG